VSDCRIYRDGGKLIKVYQSAPYDYVEQACLRQKFVRDAGLPIPAALGVKRISETETALEMEYWEGQPLTSLYQGQGEEALRKALRIMARLQCRMYAIDAGGLPDLTAMYAREITATPYLTPLLKETLLARMKSLDKGRTNLCHGDIHPLNIMTHGGKSWIIDWEDASRGDPAADACMAYFYAVRWAAKENSRGDEWYLRIFCEESGVPREEVLAWLPVIAGVQVNIEDEEDRAFIEKFIGEWHYKNLFSILMCPP